MRAALLSLVAIIALAVPVAPAQAASASGTSTARRATCQSASAWRASTRSRWKAKSARAFRRYRRRHPHVSLHRYRTRVNTLARFRKRHPRSPCPPSGTGPTPGTIPGTTAVTPPVAPPAWHPSGWVDPFIGTAPGPSTVGYGFDTGNVVPAATVPFGMTQMGPHTVDPTDPGGYDDRSTTISGFPLTALSGAGCNYYGDAPFMPYVGDVGVSPESDPGRYESTFQKTSERATPGYYSVFLDQPRTQVELTAAARANLARFTFPASDQATLLVGSSATTQGARDADVAVVGDRAVEGTVSGGGFCGSDDHYTVHFTAQFDVPFTAYGTWSGTSLSAGVRTATGGGSGAYLRFDTRSDHVVRARIAISWVSIDGARLNLAAGAPGFDFDTMRAAADTAWDTELGKIRVDGGTDTQKRVFYTALYHVMSAPSAVSDVDGRYTGFDGQVHRTTGWTQYADYSGWDGYRSWFSLLAVVEPAVASDFAQSLVMDGEQGGALPRWSTATAETGVMPGDPGPPGVASAYAFGARAFDTSTALQLMLGSALTPGTTSGSHEVRPGLADYLSQGYVAGGAPSTDLEYASSDFAISQFARALGDTADADKLEAHSQNWQNLFNPGTGYVQARTAQGTFSTPFDPAAGAPFVEGNAAQYTWMVPHDLAGLVAAAGGEDAVAGRLDSYFSQLDAGPNAPYAYLGNEPSSGDPGLYDWIGQPSRAQEVTRRALLELYGDGPGGLPGNDDLGATSAWAVWAALGLYPEIPGVGGLSVASPLFPRTTISLGDGHQLVLAAPAASATTPYVQSLALNGHPIQRTWLTWDELAAGATLDFQLGATATDWSATYRPPSYQHGLDEGIGYLAADELDLRPGQSATVTIGLANLQPARPLAASWAPTLPTGLSASWPGGPTLTAPAGGRAETSMTLSAAPDAPDGDQVVDLGLRSADGTALPPMRLRVVVAR